MSIFRKQSFVVPQQIFRKGSSAVQSIFKKGGTAERAVDFASHNLGRVGGVLNAINRESDKVLNSGAANAIKSPPIINATKV